MKSFLIGSVGVSRPTTLEETFGYSACIWHRVSPACFNDSSFRLRRKQQGVPIRRVVKKRLAREPTPCHVPEHPLGIARIVVVSQALQPKDGLVPRLKLSLGGGLPLVILRGIPQPLGLREHPAIMTAREAVAELQVVSTHPTVGGDPQKVLDPESHPL
jgi:hypothetical protein